MSVEINITEDVRNLVLDVITRYKLDPNSEVIYSQGSEAGDNYASNTVAVEITNDERNIKMFVKYALDIKSSGRHLTNLYTNEIYFYDVIYPTYLQFEADKDVADRSKNVPECIATSPKNVIALENLKYKNFELSDRKKMMNENHIVSVLKALAKFHAISFAFKDQNEAKHQKLTEGVLDFFGGQAASGRLALMLKKVIDGFRKQLDPINDKRILDRCEKLKDKVAYYFENFHTFENTYSIITKGDCWSNNIMFRYEEENKENPSDVMLIDWQLISVASPVVDLSYFFYTVASKEKLAELDYYMKLYYEELSKRINLLGSDPEVLYPYSIFVKEWKDNSIFGYGMALLVFNIMLVSKEEAPNLEKIDKENKQIEEAFASMNCSPEYYKRLKNLTEHFINNNFI